MKVMDNICILEDTTAELEKAKALVALIQSGTDDYASIDGPFKSGFEMVCTNLSTLYDILYRLVEYLDNAVDDAYRHIKPGD